MSAKAWLFIASVFTVVFGVGGFAVLGVIAKVPAAEYWMVVLGGVVVGGAWLALITVLHRQSLHE
jgi:hypothetical protein